MSDISDQVCSINACFNFLVYIYLIYWCICIITCYWCYMYVVCYYINTLISQMIYIFLYLHRAYLCIYFYQYMNLIFSTKKKSVVKLSIARLPVYGKEGFILWTEPSLVTVWSSLLYWIYTRHNGLEVLQWNNFANAIKCDVFVVSGHEGRRWWMWWSMIPMMRGSTQRKRCRIPLRTTITTMQWMISMLRKIKYVQSIDIVGFRNDSVHFRKVN